MAQAQQQTTIDTNEIAKFEAMAEAWWDPEGSFKPLHQFNPVRIRYIRDVACAHFGGREASATPLSGLSLLDVGCGGGLLTEPMARMGAVAAGIDASEKNVAIAALHAKREGLDIPYTATSAEALAEKGAQYDIVLAMEIVEHVADVEVFLTACAAMVKPGGLLFLATLNRTAKSFATAIVGAEYVMRWLPRGTHEWKKFVRPSEIERVLRAQELRIKEMTGVQYHPLKRTWSLSRDMAVNYMLVAEKPR